MNRIERSGVVENAQVAAAGESENREKRGKSEMRSAERLRRLALQRLQLRTAKCRNGHTVEAWEKECPKCRAIRQAEWRKRHPEKYKAAQKKYYDEGGGRAVRKAYQQAVRAAVRELEREEALGLEPESGWVS